jgi:hypothetical protein
MATSATHPDDADPLVLWAQAQYAIWDRWLGNVGNARAAGQATMWGRATGDVDEAVSASAKATFLTQALWARRWAERVAADPRSSKLVVESAHQLYELVTACAEAKAQTCATWFAALRSMEPERLAAPWLSAWQSALRGGLDACPPREPSGEVGADTSHKELSPPKTEPR